MSVIIPRKGAFSTWGAEKERLGLRCRYALVDEKMRVTLVLEPSTRSGERVLFEDEVELAKPLPQKERKSGMKTATIERPKTKLAGMLAKLHQQAARNPGQTVRMELKGGLRIDLIVGIDGMTRILLARRTVHPSPVEWRTTIANLPSQPPTETNPEPFIHNGWGCYRAAWRTT